MGELQVGMLHRLQRRLPLGLRAQASNSLADSRTDHTQCPDHRVIGRQDPAAQQFDHAEDFIPGSHRERHRRVHSRSGRALDPAIPGVVPRYGPARPVTFRNMFAPGAGALRLNC
jgi:hypothetical protein